MDGEYDAPTPEQLDEHWASVRQREEEEARPRARERGEWLTASEVCEELRLGRNLVYELLASGRLAALNVAAREGGRPTYRIRRSALEAFQTSPPVGAESSPRSRPARSSTGQSQLRQLERTLREERAA